MTHSTPTYGSETRINRASVVDATTGKSLTFIQVGNGTVDTISQLARIQNYGSMKIMLTSNVRLATVDRASMHEKITLFAKNIEKG